MAAALGRVFTNTTMLCNTADDCRDMLLLVPDESRPSAKLGCKPLEDGGPPWLKLCALDLP